MMRKILITINNLSVSAELNDSVSANKIWGALPLSGSANVWGDEIYFEIPVSLKEVSDAQQEVDVGTLAYWPPGSAFCLFFGRTTASQGDEIRPASEVTVIGKMLGDIDSLKSVGSGSLIVIEAA